MKLHFSPALSVLVLLLALALGATSASAQDLLARQAPIDRNQRAVDSVSLQRAIERTLPLDNTAFYTSWVNNRAHPYRAEEVPDSMVIDLTGFCMPTPSRKVTSGFGYRPRFGRVHKGLDVKVETGDTIVAAFDGRVRVRQYDAGGYGYYIVLRHPNGLETIYGHLSKQLVAENQEVKAGEPIGLGGNTGRSFGSHLHFETRVVGQAIDPSLLFDFAAQDVTCDTYVFRRASASSAAAPQQYASATRNYKVRKGETLSSIARRLGLTTKALASRNHLSTTARLQVGQILKY